MYPPKGKTAIITGGSSGIGKSSAKALALKGWNVVITGRREERLKAAGHEIQEAVQAKGIDRAIKVAYSVGDVTREEDVIKLFDDVTAANSRVDLVFCNAGVSPPSVPIEELQLADWNTAINSNLTASFLCAREAVRRMKPIGGGRIIINGSISAHVPRPDSAPYTASKHGLTGLTKSLALDGRKYNISVSQIDIGNATSDMTVRMQANQGGPGVKQADGSFCHEAVMDREYAAQEVVHIAELPLEVTKLFVVIQATGMPSMVGRG
ncbi:unnamed protein product [Parajaminaea phylloscopi]